MNEYRLRYITSSGKKNPFIKKATMSTLKEETFFAKTDESAKKKASHLVRQISKKIRITHAVLDKIESKCIAEGYELGEKF